MLKLPSFVSPQPEVSNVVPCGGGGKSIGGKQIGRINSLKDQNVKLKFFKT